MQAFPQWKLLGLMLAGMALVGLSIFLAQRWDAVPRLSLDFRGERAHGTAERSEDGAYRLRLDLGDRILSRTYEGGFGFQSSDKRIFDVTMAYDPQDPTDFQPATISYVPGTIVGLVFALGMGSILYARRIVQQVRRKQIAGKK
jgi:uncharacterized membrane protein YedE/YeeE